jgi:O-antigen ligase
MASSPLTYPLRTAWNVLLSIGSVCSIALFTIVVLGFSSWDFFQFLFWCALFFAALCLARPLSRRALAGERQSFLYASLAIWIFLMISGAIFVHNQSTAKAAKGNVDPTALFQALSWILSLAALAFIGCFRTAYLRRMFVGPIKWASIFAIVTVVSCPLSSKPMYSATLAFKLCLIVLTLCAITEGMENEEGINRFFAALFIAMLIVVSMAFIAPLLGPDPFAGGRFGMMIGLSGTCGILLLLSCLFLWLKKNPWFLLSALFSVMVMMLAGTKGGMVASFVSIMMFFFLLKKPAQALLVSFVFAIVFALCLLFTPLGRSLQKYTESGSASTLTGRTDLWDATWPSIKSHIILGNGYRASRFLSAEVPGAFAEAGNMHNSFLEVLYNNGLTGLIPIVLMNFFTVINLKEAIMRPPNLTLRYYAAAALALYIHLFVWGLVAVTFGGAPDERFMIFFAVLLISMFLRGQSDKKYWNTIYGQHSY